ncbi:hypothetical protein RvY_01115 [Ramazzottius varieornatus]|uniref:Beclin-1 n=1 Tax=Ramazzottius varieornatus TaxID=947166 RepID=A0A1D1UMB3_RAMVA|nr:hypothetical protein RvY_01115 [Ramazzottius varieornatus]
MNTDQLRSARMDSEGSSSSKGTTNYICCQRCHQLLEMDKMDHPSDEALLADLISDTTTRDHEPMLFQKTEGRLSSESDGNDDLRQNLRAAAMEDNDAEDLPLGRRRIVFTPEETTGKSEKLRLMELLSDISTIDHPVCASCTDSVMEELETEIQAVEQECINYEYFLKQYRKNTEGDGEDGPRADVEGLKQQLALLEAQEVSLREQLTYEENDRQELASREDFLTRESEKIRLAEEDYFRERAQYDREIAELDEEQESVDYQLRVAEMLLDKLKKTSVFNIAFHIWHQDQFGTINGFRLGRLPGSPVEWPEINAAWGQTVLLLHSLARRMNFIFQRYKLVPFGSHSYIECLDDQNKKLPLYGDGGFKFFWDSKFDNAMVAFLDCLHQFKLQVEKSDSGFCLPYDIEPGPARIKDVHSGASYCIRAQFNSVEQWTKALKWMLTNLKWGLAWVISQHGEFNEA